MKNVLKLFLMVVGIVLFFTAMVHLDFYVDRQNAIGQVVFYAALLSCATYPFAVYAILVKKHIKFFMTTWLVLFFDSFAADIFYVAHYATVRNILWFLALILSVALVYQVAPKNADSKTPQSQD